MSRAYIITNILPVFVGLALIASWWLSLMVLVNTPLIDLTPPKIAVLVGGAIATAAAGRRLFALASDRLLIVFAAFIAWFPLAALLRPSSADIKTSVGYAVFCGLAAVVAYTAARFSPVRASQLLAITVVAALVISFLAAAVERATYPLPGQADPLEWIWSIFRPRAGLDDPRLGYIDPPPLHSPTGEPGVVRATGLFVQTNYLAFFCVLAVPLAMAIFLIAARDGRRLTAVGAGVLVAIAVLTAYWTYARVGIAAVIVVAVATVTVEWFVARARSASRLSWASLRPTLLALAIVGAVIGASFGLDGVGAARLTGGTLGEGGSSDGRADPVAESANRSADIRLELQMTAAELVLSGSRELTIGPGLAFYETAVHDPSSPSHIPAARGIRDPNSLWLTVALAGGIVAVALLALLVGSLVLALVRVRRHTDNPWTRAAIIWLLAWLPVWASVQALGTNPFNTSESIIFGTLVGSIAGLGAALRPDRDINLRHAHEA